MKEAVGAQTGDEDGALKEEEAGAQIEEEAVSEDEETSKVTWNQEKRKAGRRLQTGALNHASFTSSLAIVNTGRVAIFRIRKTESLSLKRAMGLRRVRKTSLKRKRRSPSETLIDL